MSKQDHSRPSVVETPSENTSRDSGEETSTTVQTLAPTESAESAVPAGDQGTA